MEKLLIKLRTELMENKSMKYFKSYIEIRIAKLKTNPVENANLIRKRERMLRKAEN